MAPPASVSCFARPRRLSYTPPHDLRAAPHPGPDLGADALDILTHDLGMDPKDIATLIASGAVAVPK